MRDLLTDLYNKVVSFFQPDREMASKDIASNRLKLVLMQDRTNLDAGTLENMKTELVKVISKYVEIDQEEFGVNLEGIGDSIALMLNIPVIRAKTPEEIQAAIDEENSSKENVEEDNSSENEEESADEEAEVAEESLDSEEIVEDTEEKAPAEETTAEEVIPEEVTTSTSSKTGRSSKNKENA